MGLGPSIYEICKQQKEDCLLEQKTYENVLKPKMEVLYKTGIPQTHTFIDLDAWGNDGTRYLEKQVFPKFNTIFAQKGYILSWKKREWTTTCDNMTYFHDEYTFETAEEKHKDNLFDQTTDPS